MNTNFIILKSPVMNPYLGYDSIADEFLKLIWIWVLLVYHNHPHLSCIWMLHCITYFSMQPIAFDSWALSRGVIQEYSIILSMSTFLSLYIYPNLIPMCSINLGLMMTLTVGVISLAAPCNEGQWLAGSPDDTTSHVVHLSQCMQYAATNVNNALTAS